jgi:hypothetical protein
MNWKSAATAALVVGAVGFAAGRGWSEDDKAKPQAPGADDMMKMMEEMAKPVKQHEQIAASAGAWESDISMWEMPGAEPTKSKGSITAKSICNGLFVMSEHKSTMFGKPFEGFEFFGYDKQQQKYFGVFVCSMNSAPEIVWGTSEDDGKTVTLIGSEQTCMGMTFTPKWVLKNVDADHVTFEHWSKSAMSNNEYMKEIEIHSTRKK